MALTTGTDLLDASTGKALLINGKRASEKLLAKIGEKSRSLSDRLQPGLAVILVGSDPASQVYVKSKGKAAVSCGFYSEQHDLPESTSEAELISLIDKLNADPRIHGILLQLPLPNGKDARGAIEAIAPQKDVDGLHPVNSGLLALGDLSRALLPCTPAGCLYLLDEAAAAFGQSLAGAEALVIGRSNLVGKPIAQLLLSRNATVTLAHSKTRDLEAHIGRADILIAAIGRPEAISGSLVKEGALVIDVGINRVPADETSTKASQKTKLVGDVSFTPALEKARAITPVPGGVGPMTIAMLMANTLRAALRIQKIEDEFLLS